MSCCGTSPNTEEIDEVSRLVAGKLAAFLRTLRDNGYAVGLAEGQDAASLMALGYADRPGLLRIAFKHLFSARKADWDRFDGLFDAFWLGKRVRSRIATIRLGQGGQQPVAEEPAGCAVRAARRACRHRPDPRARRRYAC